MGLTERVQGQTEVAGVCLPQEPGAQPSLMLHCNITNGTTEEVTSDEEEEEKEEMAEDIEDLDHYEMKEEPISGKKLEDEGIEKENLAILEKIRQDHLNVEVCVNS
ncbi:ubiquitin-conjugating enzyme E2 Q2-like [Piliocolobus tephrosceles]|uniref:ubiquitin-conjugating enzyme E2 Q2-like n=1 Tax=Piliocolobus tephrosceles TaxID=591936 RepID=UPI000C2B4C43|nr:ubiquitin-conjugating enzyme E2 Q2-like [Piliocolobus tephrosceles]